MKFSIATTFALFAAVVIATPIDEEKRGREQLDCSGQDGSHCVFMSNDAYIERNYEGALIACNGRNNLGYTGTCQVRYNTAIAVSCQPDGDREFASLYFDQGMGGSSYCEATEGVACYTRRDGQLSSTDRGADFNVDCYRQ
ncbi:hypothetical protein L218DRAFT_1075139 [Marasmius fiardii PR-910]|nr:hypothetical protein L218DRAFT_1075139 [Marasmius fiardii PR-910]